MLVRGEVVPGSAGVVVTSRSVWTFDGHGRFRRTARTARTEGPSVPYGSWGDFVQARFVGDDSAVLLSVLPSGRPPGSFGLLSSTVLWTNLGTGSESLDASFGPAGEWFAPSPVPSDMDLWPGELPFTAFGQFGPDSMDLRVFDQDAYWVDRSGDPHRIESMGREYVENVTRMLLERADEFHVAYQLRECLQSAGDALLGRVNGRVLACSLGIGSVGDVSASAWMRSTPLLRRLLAT